jgi:hypothetical protein
MIRSTTPTASAVDSPCDAQSCDSRLSLPRRRLISAAGSIALGSSLPFSARAQSEWPTKPIRFVVPFPAGGGADMGAREI